MLMRLQSVILILLEIHLAISNESERPKINTVRPRIVLKAGKQASLTCVLEEGSLPIDFEWLNGNSVIRSSKNMVVDKSQRTSSLIIKSISISDTGNYTCKASNQFGSDISTSQLIVEGPPQWLSKPQDMRVGPKERFTIKCSGIGHPSPAITWKRQIDSSWKDLFDSSSVFTKISSTEISGSQLMKERDEGKYGCEVSNGINPNLWTEFQIQVSGKNSSSSFW
ncbi:cell adhesion molecule Dscam1-like [Brevipalpus obovatus]|uniref:cell adhesion molecule Dscam1-like n=1 Tax=Brevipalpus obovatus TaxID=246614 RepID=UPI003D9F7E04